MYGFHMSRPGKGCFPHFHWYFHDNSAPERPKMPRPSIGSFAKTTNLAVEKYSPLWPLLPLAARRRGKFQTWAACVKTRILGFANSQDRWRRGSARLHQSEQHHQKTETTFGSQVTVIDPEPLVAILNGRERFIRRWFSG